MTITATDLTKAAGAICNDMTRTTPAPADPTLDGPTATTTGTATYEIRVAGHLDDHWACRLRRVVRDAG